MKSWEIWTGNLFGPHPCVVVSCQARIDSKPQIVVLKCTSMQPGFEREARANEAILNAADGLDWKTLCRCDLLFTVDKARLSNKRGLVSVERRRDIARKSIQGLAIAGL